MEPTWPFKPSCHSERAESKGKSVPCSSWTCLESPRVKQKLKDMCVSNIVQRFQVPPPNPMPTTKWLPRLGGGLSSLMPYWARDRRSQTHRRGAAILASLEHCHALAALLATVAVQERPKAALAKQSTQALFSPNDAKGFLR